jgi:dTMP kinase
VGGAFVTFEGLDGSGKSSHLRRAAAWLAEQGVGVVATREPGGTELGQEIRAIFLDPRWSGQIDGRVELLLVFASRRQHLLEVIEPALVRGAVVLCDRFTDSTRAYQGYGRGVSLELVDQVDLVATGRRRPDLTLLFDLPSEVARGRCESKRASGARPGDRLDQEALAFYDRVRGGYLELARAEPERFRIVRSDRDPAETAAEVRQLLGAALGVPA